MNSGRQETSVRRETNYFKATEALLRNYGNLLRLRGVGETGDDETLIRLEKALGLFEGEKEYAVIRMYYLGEDINGRPAPSPMSLERVAFELRDAGLIGGDKTARRWRDRIVRDIAICMYGAPAAEYFARRGK